MQWKQIMQVHNGIKAAYYIKKKKLSEAQVQWYAKHVTQAG